jgi:hypothetical protein
LFGWDIQGMRVGRMIVIGFFGKWLEKVDFPSDVEQLIEGSNIF